MLDHVSCFFHAKIGPLLSYIQPVGSVHIHVAKSLLGFASMFTLQMKAATSSEMLVS
jgi:hypothetical protein